MDKMKDLNYALLLTLNENIDEEFLIILKKDKIKKYAGLS